ncbi:Ig-like domain-containing protein, partial [Paraburkholderia sp. WSM4177]|uniref:Ig-like domain-containing protein n=1 Tax=Paraburkholderia sp. WSM4177 TaxID=2723098 RepID=UPI00161DC14B
TQVDEDGNWSFTPDTPLDEGEHEFTVVERDPAGNESRPSEPHVVIIDTTVPALVLKAPEVPEMADGVIDAVEASNGTWVVIPGYAGMVVGDTITLDWNGKTYEHVVSVIDSVQGAVKVLIPADDLVDLETEFDISYTVTDAEGHVSEPSPETHVRLDTLYSGSDSVATIAGMSKDSDRSYDDPLGHFVTNDGSAGRLITGSLTAPLARGEKVQVSVDGGKTWQDALIDGKGKWVFQDNTAHNADWTIQARVLDRNGDSSDVMSQKVTLDAAIPNAPTAVSISTDGTIITARLPGSAVVGDVVIFAVGDYRFCSSSRLTEANISAGTVSVRMPVEAAEAFQSGALYGAALQNVHGNVSGYTGTYIQMSSMEIVAHEGYFNTYSGTTGDDVFLVSNTAVFDDKWTELKGIGGTDTLKLTSADQILDLTNLHGLLMSIEVFDITGTGNNTLKLSLGDVLEQGGQDLFIADGRTQVMVKGDAGDRVDLSDLLPGGGDVGDWVRQSGTTMVDGTAYDVFYHTALNAELLVQHGVDTTLLNH